MKDKVVTLLATALLKVAVVYDEDVSPRGWYKPKKVKEDTRWNLKVY